MIQIESLTIGDPASPTVEIHRPEGELIDAHTVLLRVDGFGVAAGPTAYFDTDAATDGEAALVLVKQGALILAI